MNPSNTVIEASQKSKQASSPLLRLIELGQSYWLDNLTREKIKSGELKRRVEREGLRGITSNPSIFNKAISKSQDYDQEIQTLVKKGFSIEAIYETLTVGDVQDACDVLRPVYDQSDGVDGFVSLEVSPYLAHDPDGTMEEVRRLFESVKRPNCFIKIPGTDACVPAIEQMLYEGININITLLFSIDSYEAVARAYVKALERRVAEKKPVDRLTSVASFFLSRIDVLTDQLLSHRIIPGKNSEQTGPEPLMGQAAIANARLAYQSFKKIFSGSVWERLVHEGARVQRPLWASTSTKNPLYRDVRYVETLIGPDTVNTLPDETIDAFADHGGLSPHSVEQHLDESAQVLQDLKRVGVDLDFVTRQLVNEGVQKFIDPYDQLMTTLADKRQEILKESVARQTLLPGPLDSGLKSACQALDESQFSRRLFQKDTSLWETAAETREDIRAGLGWLDFVADLKPAKSEILKSLKKLQKEEISRIVVLGMGASSTLAGLGGQLGDGKREGFPPLTVLSETDPDAVLAAVPKNQLKKAVFIVSSPPGTTLETVALYRHFFQQLEEAGVRNPGSRFIAITNTGSSLEQEARKHKFRHIFAVGNDVPSRFSGLLEPFQFLLGLGGADLPSVLDQAASMRVGCGAFVPAQANPGIRLGALLGVAHQQGHDKVTLLLPPALSGFGQWLEHLLAESTGKSGRGLVPILEEELAEPAAYDRDRLFVSISLGKASDRKQEAKLNALEKGGHPIVRISLPDKTAVGGEIFRWQLAAITAASILQVNPFDEPNVPAGRKLADDHLKTGGAESLPEAVAQQQGLSVFGDDTAPWFSKLEGKNVRQLLRKFVSQAQTGGYVGILVHFAPSKKRLSFLNQIRRDIRSRHQVASTLNFGPAYLHTVGQLHKGGPEDGVFLVLTADPKKDVSIPGRDYALGSLHEAQATGDFQALQKRKRPVLRIHLGKDIESGLDTLAGFLA